MFTGLYKGFSVNLGKFYCNLFFCTVFPNHINQLIFNLLNIQKQL